MTKVIATILAPDVERHDDSARVIGRRTTYHGDEHPYLRGHEVVIVAVLKNALHLEEHDYLTTEDDVRRAGGVGPDDRIEVAPVLADEKRLSFATSDPRAIDLEAFRHLARAGRQPMTKEETMAKKKTEKQTQKKAKKTSSSSARRPKAPAVEDVTATPAAAPDAVPAQPRTPDARLPAPGTVLQKRDRHGAVRCECTVEEAGVRYAGNVYRSLSAAAMAAAKDLGLTNKTQNGFVFWGDHQAAAPRQRSRRRAGEGLGPLPRARGARHREGRDTREPGRGPGGHREARGNARRPGRPRRLRRPPSAESREARGNARRPGRGAELMSRDFYAEANPTGEETHSVDAAIARRLPHKSLRRKIRAATNAMLAALGPRRDLWLKLEDLTTRYRMDREEAYFNPGYDLGAAAGRSEALAASVRCGSRAQRELAARIRDITIETELPPPIKVATLLEAAWALVIGKDAAPSGRTRGRRASEARRAHPGARAHVTAGGRF